MRRARAVDGSTVWPRTTRAAGFVPCAVQSAQGRSSWPPRPLASPASPSAGQPGSPGHAERQPPCFLKSPLFWDRKDRCSPTVPPLPPPKHGKGAGSGAEPSGPRGAQQDRGQHAEDREAKEQNLVLVSSTEQDSACATNHPSLRRGGNRNPLL